MGDCMFFRSDAWDRRIRGHVGRVWDLETYLRKIEHSDIDAQIERIATAVGADAADLAVKPIGEFSHTGDIGPDISLKKAAEVWRASRDWLPESCPHDPVAGADQCPFHLSPETYETVEMNDETVTKKLQFALDPEHNDGAKKCFIGARLQSLDLADLRVETTDNEPLDFRLATVREGIDCTNAHFEPPVTMEGALLATELSKGEDTTGSASNRYISLAADIEFKGAVFDDTADFKHCLFDASTSFNGAECDDVAMFNNSCFNAGLELWATFKHKVDFSKAEITGPAQLRSNFDHAAIFNYTIFSDDVILWNSSFEHKAEFLAATVKGVFECEHAQFKGTTRFVETTFEKGANFKGSVFADQIRFRRIICSGEVISLNEAHLEAGRIELGADPVHYDLREATLGRVSIDSEPDADLPTDPLAHLAISRTNFEGFDFSNHARSFKPDWRVDDLASTWPVEALDQPSDTLDRYERLEDTYLRAKSGATESGYNKAASEFFVHEMVYRRKQHAVQASRRLRKILIENPSSMLGYAFGPMFAVGRALRDGLARLNPRYSRGYRERSITPVWQAVYRWISNGALGLVTGYGERPKRPIALSLATIVVFAVLYWLAGSLPTSDAPFGMGYLLLSMQSFITFILGPSPAQSDFLPQMLSAIEGFAGAFLTAVFVFTLTRSIHR